MFISVICVALSMEDSDILISPEGKFYSAGSDMNYFYSRATVRQGCPVEKTAENEYRIRFENNLTFQPDSLVNITRRFIGQGPLTGDYVVNVLNCGNASVVYGYGYIKNRKMIL